MDLVSGKAVIIIITTTDTITYFIKYDKYMINIWFLCFNGMHGRKQGSAFMKGDLKSWLDSTTALHSLPSTNSTAPRHLLIYAFCFITAFLFWFYFVLLFNFYLRLSLIYYLLCIQYYYSIFVWLHNNSIYIWFY